MGNNAETATRLVFRNKALSLDEMLKEAKSLAEEDTSRTFVVRWRYAEIHVNANSDIDVLAQQAVQAVIIIGP